jgi:hypothetical protein
MAITYNAAVKTSRITATRDYFANGTLEILTAADVLLATFGLSASGGTISGLVWTLTWDATTVAAVAAGTATKAQIKNAGAAAHLTGLTVGTSGTDIIIDNTVIAAGQNVTVGTSTIAHA